MSYNMTERKARESVKSVRMVEYEQSTVGRVYGTDKQISFEPRM